MISDESMKLVAEERWASAEELLKSASSAELFQVWKDAGYLKERVRFLIKSKYEITLP